MKSLILNDLIGKNHNLFAFASGTMSFVVDQFAQESIGSLVAVLIFFGTGIFSILKARESWLVDRDARLNKKRTDDFLFKQKMNSVPK